MKQLAVGLLAALTLSACGNSEPAPAVQATNPQVGASAIMPPSKPGTSPAGGVSTATALGETPVNAGVSVSSMAVRSTTEGEGVGRGDATGTSHSDPGISTSATPSTAAGGTSGAAPEAAPAPAPGGAAAGTPPARQP